MNPAKLTKDRINITVLDGATALNAEKTKDGKRILWIFDEPEFPEKNIDKDKTYVFFHTTEVYKDDPDVYHYVEAYVEANAATKMLWSSRQKLLTEAKDILDALFDISKNALYAKILNKDIK